MSKHTPGPWLIDSRNKKIKDRGGFERIAIYESEANARLIAAAPDMLAALQDIVARNEIQHWFNLDLARAAIAKAEGGS